MLEMPRLFLVTQREAQPACIEAWSTVRLPFEPKGWHKSFRQELQHAVHTLRATPNELLHAVYSSPDRQRVDTENLLFYNVGTSHFATAAVNGLRFERAFRPPPLPSRPLSSMVQHYWRYMLVEAATPAQCWEPGDTLARWRVPVAPSMFTDCSRVWYAVKGSGQVRVERRPMHFAPFGLSLTLHVPTQAVIQPAAFLKTLFDGVIAALHHHDGTDLAEISQRLTARVPAEPKEIADLLMASRGRHSGRGDSCTAGRAP